MLTDSFESYCDDTLVLGTEPNTSSMILQLSSYESSLLNCKVTVQTSSGYGLVMAVRKRDVYGILTAKFYPSGGSSDQTWRSSYSSIIGESDDEQDAFATGVASGIKSK